MFYPGLTRHGAPSGAEERCSQARQVHGFHAGRHRGPRWAWGWGAAGRISSSQVCGPLLSFGDLMTTQVRDTLAWQSAVCVDCQGGITNKRDGGRLLLLSWLVSHFSSVGQRRWRASKAWPTFPLSDKMEMGSTYFFASVCRDLINITVVIIKQRSVYILQQRNHTSSCLLSVCVCVREWQKLRAEIHNLTKCPRASHSSTDFKTLLSGLTWTRAAVGVS